MKRVITVSLCLFAVIAFSLTSFAQEISMSTQSGFTPNQIEGVGAVLYDQTVGGNTNAYTSQDFEPANDPFDNQLADDFTATDTWTIDQVVVTGTYSVAGPADGFNIYFYENNAGIPGTEVYSELLAPYTYDGVSLFTITMVTPAVLPAGDYWVSVQCNMDFSVGGQWFWNQVDGSFGNAAQWQNPLDGFGTGCTTWQPVQTCIGAIGTDQYFALLGTAGGGGATCVFLDDFEGGLVNWDVVLPQDPCDWGIYDSTTWDTNTLAAQLPPSASGDFFGASSDYCGSVMNVYANGNFVLDLTNWTEVYVGFGSDFQVFGAPVPADTARLDISVDGGVTWTEIFYRGPVDAPAEEIYLDVSSIAQFQSDVRFRLCYYGDFSWHWVIDNFTVCVDGFIPVELTSFTASVNGNDVTLSWVTATELNNEGFEIERNSGSGFENIGYVAGFGTSSESHSYTFVDASLNEGTYTYRLKQVDLDGTFEYSDAVEVEVTIPDVYALEQNYPNPFNPSTKIDFSLAMDSKVNLKVFDILGQEVATLINSDLVAGSHKVDFDASLLNSGVYFYRIEATGIDGTNFTNVKKMILTK